MRDIVDIIGELKYEINNTLKLQEKDLMFQPSFEDSKRMKTLGTPCTTEADMQNFSTVLYTVVYEETKVGKANKATLGEFQNDPFTYYVSELRHYYDHGFAEYTSTKKVKVSDVFNKYLKKTVAPKSAEEFQAIQRGILNDFIDFLNKINESIQAPNIAEKSDIKGVICKDDKGNIFCQNVLLPQRLKEYVGCECRIRVYRENQNRRTKKTYPYFAFAPQIKVSIVGFIEIDENDICHINNIKLSEKLKLKKGSEIEVSVMFPIVQKDSPYDFLAIETKIIKTKSKKKSKAQPDITPSVPLGENVVVEVDSDNITFVGNIHIGRKRNCKKGDTIKILKVQPNPTAELKGKYPLTAVFVKKVVDNNGIAKIYTIEEDENGRLHADNIMLLPKAKCVRGDRIMILQVSQNKDQFSNQTYPLVAKKVVVLNENIPDVEEKATTIVSKYQKFVEPGLKWLAAVVVAGILLILGKYNLIKNQ